MDNNIELYYNENKTKVGVLVSTGFGAGWSTWNNEALAYDKRVIEWWLEHNTPEYCEQLTVFKEESEEHKEAVAFFKNIGYDDVFFGGYQNLKLQWVPRGMLWRFYEHDGFEWIEFLDTNDWNIF